MEPTRFVSLSRSILHDLKSWVEEARQAALLSDLDLRTLGEAVDVIDRTTTVNAQRAVVAAQAVPAEGTLEQRAAEAADEAGSAFLPHDKVLDPPLR